MTQTQKPADRIRPTVKAVVILVVLATAVCIFMLKEGTGGENPAEPGTGGNTSLPRLLDLGRGKCIPCKMMEPVLEELREDLAGQLRVDYIDLTKTPGASGQYGIKTIPTQIFYDARGQELYRHVGFYSKADIVAKWQELGFTFATLDEYPEEDLKIIDNEVWGK